MFQKKRWSEREINILKNNYLSKDWTSLLKILPKRSEEAIRAKAKRLRLLRGWGEKDEKTLKEKYPTSFSKQLKKIFPNRSLQAIHTKPHRLGLKKENYFNNINTDFFSLWSQNMAYVLGFVSADGCIHINKKDNRYQLIIAINDLYLLKRVKEVMRSTHPIQKIIRKWGPIFRLSICSKKLVSDLLILEITPRKTHNLKFPKIPQKFIKHFIRGFLDGDGSIVHTSFGEKKYLQVMFTNASKDFLYKLNKTICEHTYVKSKRVFFSRDVFVLEYTQNDAKKILNWVYSDSKIHLQRKFKKFKELMNVVQ